MADNLKMKQMFDFMMEAEKRRETAVVELTNKLDAIQGVQVELIEAWKPEVDKTLLSDLTKTVDHLSFQLSHLDRSLTDGHILAISTKSGHGVLDLSNNLLPLLTGPSDTYMRGAASGHAGSDGHHQHLENRGPQIEPPSNGMVSTPMNSKPVGRVLDFDSGEA